MNTDISGIIVLLAFIIGFVAIAVWAYWPSNRAKLQAQAFIPLMESDSPSETGALQREDADHGR